MILLKLNKHDLCTLVVRVATLLLVTRNLVSKINTSSIRAVIGSCEWWWSDSKKTVVHTKRCLIDNTFQMLQKHFFFLRQTQHKLTFHLPLLAIHLARKFNFRQKKIAMAPSAIAGANLVTSINIMQFNRQKRWFHVFLFQTKENSFGVCDRGYDTLSL